MSFMSRVAKKKFQQACYKCNLKKFFANSFWYLAITVFILIFLYQISFVFPEHGHDFGYFIKRLVAGRRHFFIQGLSPYRYIAYFCGGIVMYGNPNGMYYSILQLLTLFIDPWVSIKLVVIFSIILGYVGWFLFARDVIKLKRVWSHVLSIIILSNGFYLVQVFAGHVCFISFPLIGFLFWLFFTPKTDTKRTILSRTAIFTLIVAHIFYSCGYTVLPLAIVGILMGVPLCFIFHPSNRVKLSQLCIRILTYGAGVFAITAGKLVAVVSVMGNLSRSMPFDKMQPEDNTLYFIVKAFWAIPQRLELLKEVSHGLHEKSMLMSPVTIIGLLLFFILFIFSKVKTLSLIRKLLVLSYLIFLLYIFMEFAQGYGYFITFLEQVPFFIQTRKTSRFIILLAILISIGSAWAFGKMFSNNKLIRYEALFGGLIITITLSCFYLGYPKETLNSISNFGNITEARNLIAENPIPKSVEFLTSDSVGFKFLEGKSGIACYEPLFNKVGQKQIDILHVGRVTDENNGFFNMINPSCYQYPKENDCEPWDRISVNDEKNFNKFLRGEKVDWKISRLQAIADWTSGTTFFLLIGVLLYLTIMFIYRIRK